MAERMLIDGRSGSGKTELAAGYVARHPGTQLLRLDDLYPGWDGLDAASAALPGILRSGRWRDWDWAADAPGTEHVLDLDRPIVVEGVGALSRASRPLAHVAVWVELDARTRRQRALRRDGETYEPHWHRWARQEDAFIERERPAELADLVVDGRSARDALAALLAFVAA